MVKIRVAPSRTYGRRDNDLTLKVPITFTEATLGTKIDVPTLNGGVKVKIPSGTPSGKTFRVRGKGIAPERGKQGDLLVTVEIAVPKNVSREEKKILEELAEHETEDIRQHLR
jgi:molecular chaperone DnaJ